MSIEQTVQMTDRVHEMALGSGIEMDFDKALPVNTFHAHRVLQMAKKMGKGPEMKERLFKAYFTEGVNIADHKVLETLAADVGLSEEDLRNALADPSFADAVNADVQEARSFGISGVPYFVIDRKYGISGAQPVQTFDNALQQAFAEWKGAALSETKASADGAACTPEGECD
jgi:predicted DsbA family dithiol-disulfide isomerase